MGSGSVGTLSLARAWYEANLGQQNYRSDPFFSGSFQTSCPDRSPLHPFEREAGYTIPAVRTSPLQTALPSSAESFRVRSLPYPHASFGLTSTAMLIPEHEYGSAHFASSETLSLLITKTSPSNKSR
jgi:hypothetical protein